MKRIASSITLLGLVLPGPAMAQKTAPANTLTRALATFTAADLNKDGKLGGDEVTAIPISRNDFQAQDYDRDGSWSRDEFLVFYRQRVMLAGQSVGADLEAETVRVQAVRKAKAAEDAKLKAAQSGSAVKTSQPSNVESSLLQRSGAAAVTGGAKTADQPGPSLAAIEAALQSALDALEKRAAAAQASRDDFQKVHDQLVARARAAANSGAAADAGAVYGSDAYRKMLQSLDRLEKRAAEGVYSRQEYQEFRDGIIHRSRLIAGQSAADHKSEQNASSPELAAIQSGLLNALDDLEKRAAAGHATRGDFQRVRDQMVARARAAASASPQSGPDVAPGSDTYQKMMQALDRLEKRAAEGGYSREEYQELRAMFVHRAREIQNAKDGTGGPSEQRERVVPPQAGGREVQPAQPAGATTPAAEPGAKSTPVRGTPAPQPRTSPEAAKPQRPPPPAANPPKGDAKPDAQRPPARPTPPK